MAKKKKSQNNQANPPTQKDQEEDVVEDVTSTNREDGSEATGEEETIVSDELKNQIDASGKRQNDLTTSSSEAHAIEIQRLQRENTTLKEDYEKQIQLLKEEAELASRRSKNEQRSSEESIKKLKDEISSLKSQAPPKPDVQQDQRALEELRAKFQQHEAQYKKRIQELEESLESANARPASDIKDDDDDDAMSALTSLLADAQQEISDLKATISDLEDRLAASTSTPTSTSTSTSTHVSQSSQSSQTTSPPPASTSSPTSNPPFNLNSISNLNPEDVPNVPKGMEISAYISRLEMQLANAKQDRDIARENGIEADGEIKQLSSLCENLERENSEMKKQVEKIREETQTVNETLRKQIEALVGRGTVNDV
eukprot:TRINITY_DN3727_c0_g2_i1.p1 TRINITY_DN3727_c0_g2~~TRINITY_DN3727_c0_g2_i1.p1  ORF type:complete len:370 (+),score=163.60 TRINITY_DN3727_c0_g2_i1:19-1128(+)